MNKPSYTNNPPYITYYATEDDINYCLKHADLMCKGAPTQSFKNEKYQSKEVYFIGKVGEYFVHKLFLRWEELGLIKINHIPFREDYSRFNYNDDFIVTNIKTGIRTQIEVRTKRISVDPRPTFDCCTDSIKPHLLYIFVSYNKNNEGVSIVGCANWGVFKEYATIALIGESNNNFKHKRNEFIVNVGNLIRIEPIKQEQR